MAFENSILPDFIGDTLGEVANLYKSVEATKLQVGLARAQASLANLETANQMRDAQARAESIMEKPESGRIFAGMSNAGLILAGIAAVAIFFYVKK